MKNYTDLDWLSINKGQAEIHMMVLTEAIYDAMNESTPKQLKEGEWHIPFEDKINIPYENNNGVLTQNALKELCKSRDYHDLKKVKISTAMAARTSYTVIGDEKEIDYQKMIELHDRLISQNPPHSSPMEHCARAMTEDEYYQSYKGNDLFSMPQYNKEDIIESYLIETSVDKEDESFGWCRNFKGFIPYRHIVESKYE